jgi:hypothetical protein
MGLLDKLKEELEKAQAEGKTAVVFTEQHSWGKEWPPTFHLMDTKYLDTITDVFVIEQTKRDLLPPRQ